MIGWTATPTNMVQAVRNIIEGYDMGPLRALAQDPVQNSVDAATRGSRKPVRVAYELHRRRHDGGEYVVLTITDSNTTGLRGDVLDPEKLHQRRALVLTPEENWAAWEAMGYTKVGEEKLGSRGQGKAAFLYQSLHQVPYGREDGETEYIPRMFMLYDTLLADGTYRLGARLARPDDVVMRPVLVAGAARKVISGSYEDRDLGLDVHLGLRPLETPGTRVILPFLREEALEAFESGEMADWLERCWWRAIQKGRVVVTVGREGETPITIGVPAWWANEPWRERTLPRGVELFENIKLDGYPDLCLKRVVLSHDPSLDEARRLQTRHAEYDGVQVFRGSQWVETRGTKSEFGDYIPQKHRSGFRGFVEFDKRLDAVMKEEEKPQHDGFARRALVVRLVDSAIDDCVRKFAENRGWYKGDTDQVREDKSADEVLKAVVGTFVSGTQEGTDRGELRWKAQLNIDFPIPTVTRVDWGESLRNIESSVQHTPHDKRIDVTATLFLVDPDGAVTDIETKSAMTAEGKTSVSFGDYDAVKVATADSEQLVFPGEGRYKLGVRWATDSGPVARATEYVHVRVEMAAEPPARPISASTVVRNLSDPSGRRIDYGDEIEIEITVSNRSQERVSLALEMTVEQHQLAFRDVDEIVLPPALLGGAPNRQSWTWRGRITEDPTMEPGGIDLPAGRHTVQADLWRVDEVAAHSTAILYVEIDPKHASANPFDVRLFAGTVRDPIWRLSPAGGADPWLISCNQNHPLYVAAETADAASARKPKVRRILFGTKAFWAETFCQALVERACAEFAQTGDETGLLLLRAPSTTDDAGLEKYESALDRLLQGLGTKGGEAALMRDLSSVMIFMVSERMY